MKRMPMLFSIALAAAAALSIGFAATAAPVDIGMHTADSVAQPFDAMATMVVYKADAQVTTVSVSPARSRTAEKRVKFIEQPFQTFAVVRMEPRLPDIVIST